MKSLIATAALTVLFLSAGVVHSIGKNRPATFNVHAYNITVIHKNQAWPVLGVQGFGSCQTVRCMDV
jgi:hypothetical protein